MDDDGSAKEVSNDVDSDNMDSDNVSTRKGNEIEDEDDNFTEESERDNDTLVDLTFNENRRRRSLIYAEGGVLEDVTTESQLSLDEAIKRQEMIDQNTMEDEEPQRMNRWDFYKIIERMAEG